MKSLTNTLLVFLFVFGNLSAQTAKQFGPIKENKSKCFILNGGTVSLLSEGFLKEVGFDNWSPNETKELRTFMFWTWTSQQIPSKAQIKSVKMEFSTHGWYQNYDWYYNLYSIPSPDVTGYDYFNSCNEDNFFYQGSTNRYNNQTGFVTVTINFTSGAVIDAIQSAVQNGTNFFTLGMTANENILSLPRFYWDIVRKDAGLPFQNTNAPAIDLTIEYYDANEYEFVNNIGGTTDYGNLILDNNISTPVPSGTRKIFKTGEIHTVRTNELPYIPNVLGQSYKYQFFSNSTNIDAGSFVLQYSFSNSSINPTTISVGANFLPTEKATLKTSVDGYIFGGTIGFRDPYYYENNGGNWSQSNVFKNYLSPFVMEKAAAGQYGGVFNGLLINDANPYYSAQVTSPVQSIIPATGRNHKLYFQKWSASSALVTNPNNLETPIVFNGADAQVCAVYKGTQLASDINAYSSNSQRKLVKTTDGKLHQVYESMGQIWYEISSDNGQTWEITNNGKPIDEGRCPSISYHVDNIGIVYQKGSDASTSAIIAKFYTGSTCINTMLVSRYIFDPSQPTNPVMTWFNGYPYSIILWQNARNSEGARGIGYCLYTQSSDVAAPDFTQHETGILLGSNQYSVNPTVSRGFAKKQGGVINPPPEDEMELPIETVHAIYMAWEQGNSSNNSSNISCKIYWHREADSQRGFTETSNISIGSGYEINKKPSIVAFNHGARVVWIGEEYEGPGYISSVVFKALDYSYFWIFGNQVNSPSINKTTLDEGNDTGAKYYFAWTNQNGSGTAYFVDNTLSTIWTLRDASNNVLTGHNIQTGNGTSLTTQNTLADCYTQMFNKTALPYRFQTSKNILSCKNGLGKIGQNFANSRTGVLSAGNAQFSFSLGAITNAGVAIPFVSVHDTLRLTSVARLNSITRTEAFTVSSNKTINYSVRFGVIDTLSAISELGNTGYIRFRVELIDDVNGEILYSSDDITFTKDNVGMYENIDYELNILGIGSRVVRLVLETETSIFPQIHVVDATARDIVQAKAHAEKIDVDLSRRITTYALGQNYPNPFNPSTVISYQLPKAGLVTLKVYDMLGKEVKVLVNEYKESGKYSVEFNGSGLASGVYVYRIDCNDFHATKKLTLLK